MEEEIWKECSRFERFEISTLGRVRYASTKYIKDLYANKQGYQCLNKTKIHTLVLETFVGPRPSGEECRHLNSIKTDNRLKNLCWGTHLENMRDMVAKNDIRRSSRKDLKDLLPIEVLTVKELMSMKKKSTEIAHTLNIYTSTVRNIRRISREKIISGDY